MKFHVLAWTVLTVIALTIPREAPALDSPYGFALENGDVNGDMERDLSDVIYLFGHLFRGGPAPVPLALCGTLRPENPNGDANADGSIDLSDSVRLLGWLFMDADEPAPSCPGQGGTLNPRVIPPWSTAFGTTYGELSNAWWNWALSVPGAMCPIEDPDGSLHANGQSGKVWFLAGTSGWKAERTVTVPFGKAIFFPIINTVWVTIPPNQYYPAGDPPFSVPGAEQAARDAIAYVADADVLVCEVDGSPLTITPEYRIQSPVYTATLAIDCWGFAGILDYAGSYPDSVSDGFWVLLPPLSKGQHTIHFLGGITAFAWAVEATFHINVQ